MNVLYSHIFPAYREYAELTDEARIDWLRRDRWRSCPSTWCNLRCGTGPHRLGGLGCNL